MTASRPVPRRFVLAATAAALPLLGGALVGGCASPAPAPRWYALRAALPPGVDAPAAAAAAPLVQLLGVTVPELLERDTLLVADGASGVVPLSGHRWAEPLRDAVPRLLRADLERLLGEARLWGVPLPPGVAAQRTLRVDIVALLADPVRAAVELHARVAIATPAPVAVATGTETGTGAGAGAAPVTAAAAPAIARTLRLSAASSGPSPDALAQAHRLVLWRLAEAIAALLRA